MRYITKRIKPADPLIAFKMPRGHSPSLDLDEVVTIELREGELSIQGAPYSTDETSENYLNIRTDRIEGKNRVINIQAENYLVRRFNELNEPYIEVAKQALERAA
ncbi:hypothetical protein HOE04_00275 [archaeon]|jgi:hypothetical protein|nr:hypothetical protein [archaeon]